MRRSPLMVALTCALLMVTATGSSTSAQPKKEFITLFRQPAGLGEHEAIAPLSPASLAAGRAQALAPRTSSGPATEAQAGPDLRTTGSGGTQSEISLAATAGGQNVVLAYNGGPQGLGITSSQNGGRTFGAEFSAPVPAGSNPCCDPSVVGDAGNSFFLIQLFRDDGANAPAAGNCTNSLHISTNGGQTFSNIVSSPFSYAPGSGQFPDQPHIGIDRTNPNNLYVTTRHFTSGINCPQTGGGGNVQGEIVCSNDGGATWSNPLVWPQFTDTAHIGVGADGRTYVAGMGIGTNPGTARVVLWRSNGTNCPGAGNTPAFTGPTVVADNLTFGASGIDREFVQPDVIVDPTNSQRVFVSFSADSAQGSGDREVFLATCTFVGAAGTCPAPVTINDNPVDGTQQYFVMTCMDPVSNAIYASWNDARAGVNHQVRSATITGNGTTVSASQQISDITWPIINPGGSPDYGDYNENNGACRANHHYAAWTSQLSPPGVTPASTSLDVFFTVVNDPPVANAAGGYLTAEGAPVGLSGSATDTENDTPFVFEWDLDNDGQFDDATGQTPTFTDVGQDGVFPICLRVTDSVGDAGTDCTTVTVSNSPPSVVGLGSDAPRDEGSAVTVSGSIVDAGFQDVLTGTIDFGDGSGPQPLAGTLENNPPDATLSFAVPNIYYDNGLYLVTVCGQDDSPVPVCDTISVQVNNVTPNVAGAPGQDTEIDEGDTLGVLATFADPGSLDTYTSTVDWGDPDLGTEPGTLTLTQDGPAGDDEGEVTASETYGDNGVFTVTTSVQDDDLDVGADGFSLTVNNLDPSAAIDLSGATVINGVPTILGHAGAPVDFNGNSRDPGSDDLRLTWDFDDGTPLVISTSRVNPPLDDPPSGLDPSFSPAVSPRNVDDPRTHTFAEACVFNPTFTSDDDDGGHGDATAAVLITGNADRSRPAPWWKHQYDELGSQDFDDATLLCYLEIARFTSAVFDEDLPLSSLADAEAILHGSGGSERTKLERELLGALLNFANGPFDYGELIVDTDGDHTPDLSFGDAVVQAEAVRAAPGATPAQLRGARALLQQVNR